MVVRPTFSRQVFVQDKTLRLGVAQNILGRKLLSPEAFQSALSVNLPWRWNSTRAHILQESSRAPFQKLVTSNESMPYQALNRAELYLWDAPHNTGPKCPQYRLNGFIGGSQGPYWAFEGPRPPGNPQNVIWVLCSQRSMLAF